MFLQMTDISLQLTTRHRDIYMPSFAAPSLTVPLVPCGRVLLLPAPFLLRNSALHKPTTTAVRNYIEFLRLK